MSSTFFGLNISISGLSSSQRGLGVTSHNISNANTEGYSRQTVDFHASTPDNFGSLGVIGTGTESDPVRQIRDDFLDFSYRGENNILGEFDKKYEVFQTIEGIINEPSDSGFTTLLNNFNSSLQELNKTPESLTTRALVRQRAVALMSGINNVSASLKKLQTDLNFEAGVYVGEINGYAKQIAGLNEQIFRTELDGGKANDVRDQRNLILDKLSKIVKVQYYEDSQSRFHISIQGHELVNHFSASQLKTVARDTPNNEDDVPELYDIKWSDGSTFTNTGGALKGVLDMRDGTSNSSKGIPYYIDKLNEFVDVFATEMNRVQSSGYDLKKDTGTYFFTENGMDTQSYEDKIMASGFTQKDGTKSAPVDVTESVMSGVTLSMTEDEKNVQMRKNIAGILSNTPSFAGKKVLLMDGKYYVADRMKADMVTISKDLDTDLNKFAASTTPDGVPGNGQNALNLSNVKGNTGLYDWGSPDDYIKTLTSNLGVDGQEAKRISENQKVLVNNVQTRRDSISGVSLDEEMSQMLKFQHAYNANARMMTTIDGMLDTLINRLGLVGR